jgi:hypothetical protein
MNKKFSDDKISDEFNGKIQSVRGPSNGAPIGFGVHKLSVEGGEPYARKHGVDEPENGVQHQPVMLPKDFYKGQAPEEAETDPLAAYRKEVGEKGVRAADATLDKLVAKGMTDTPKVRWSNSILEDVKKNEEDADKAANEKVSADPNAGAPKTPETDPAKVKKAMDAAAKDAPNPNAQPEDPSTDPAAMAKIENDNEKEPEAAKPAEGAAAPAEGAPSEIAPALAQIRNRDVDPTKIESVRGPSNGAPIGYGVHKLAIEGGNPYAAKQMYRAEEPENGIQHQPIILKKEAAPEAPVAAPVSEMAAYRATVGSEGVRADDANWDKLIAKGMTSTPKVRWSNSILEDVKKKEEDADKAANEKVVADPNAGAPKTPETDPAKIKKALEKAAKDAPNPNEVDADPAEDPAAVAEAANKAEEPKAEGAAAEVAPAAALAQIRHRDIDPTKIESVRGPSNGAPIGYGVHKLAIEGGNPYAAKQMYRAEEP